MQYLIGSKDAQGSGRPHPSPLLVTSNAPIPPPGHYGPNTLPIELRSPATATRDDLVIAVRRALTMHKITQHLLEFLVYRLAGKELTADRPLKQQGVTLGAVIQVQYDV
jgi:hypothetical protein